MSNPKHNQYLKELLLRLDYRKSVRNDIIFEFLKSTDKKKRLYTHRLKRTPNQNIVAIVSSGLGNEFQFFLEEEILKCL